MKKLLSLLLSVSLMLCLFPTSAFSNNEFPSSLGYYMLKAETTAQSIKGTVNNSGVTLNPEDIIATGNTVIYNRQAYTAVVLGDVSGDGKINSTDFMQIRRYYLGLFLLCDAFLVSADVNFDQKVNSTDFMQVRKHYLGLFDLYKDYQIGVNGGDNVETGITWEEGKAFPTFSAPDDTVDAINVTSLGTAELLAMTALQGIVNRTRPRILFYDNNPDEGSKTWSQTDTVGIKAITDYTTTNKYDLFKKYIGEAKGAVLYSDATNKHFRNLASTVAATRDLIPVSKSLLNTLNSRGMNVEVKVDLTSLSFENNVALYNYLYDNYWDDCDHRILVSASPNDVQHVRDMAAATGSAVVYLDCTNAEEKAVFEKFLGDMKAGNGIVLGWYTTERSGITTATSYGLSTVPADLYINSTFYSGTDDSIAIPSVPDKPQLENKMYIALYISDGDNIQYNQRYMRKLWDQSKNDRGKVAINWTISPALADLGPSLMNYYYTTATDKDCFVCGPSGLGYSMPVNTLAENGAPNKNYLEGKDDLFKAFVNFTDTYLERTGLRVVTVWDNLSPVQRAIYAQNSDYLYGLTIHEWNNHDGLQSSVEGNTLIQQLTPCYSGNLDDIKHYFNIAMENYNGSSPAFFSAQASVWGSVKPTDIVRYAQELKALYPNQIEFVRADHYFALYNEANGLSYDLSLNSCVTATASSNSSDAALTLDGTPYGESIWVAENNEEAYITYDLGDSFDLSRIVIRHAEANGYSSEYNNAAFKIELSQDGTNWNTAYEQSDNSDAVSDIRFDTQLNASKVKITVSQGGSDNIARIADIEIYGIKA